MKAAVLKGAKLQQGFNRVELAIKENRVVGVTTDKEVFYANHIVVAAGAWADGLLEPLDIKLGLEPLRGQLVVFDTPSRVLPFPVYTKSRGYVVPKKEGYTFAGSTVEHVGFDASTTSEATEKLTHQARALVPLLANKSIRGTIAGLRPGSPDELPFLGALPSYPNVIASLTANCGRLAKYSRQIGRYRNCRQACVCSSFCYRSCGRGCGGNCSRGF